MYFDEINAQISKYENWALQMNVRVAINFAIFSPLIISYANAFYEMENENLNKEQFYDFIYIIIIFFTIASYFSFRAIAYTIMHKNIRRIFFQNRGAKLSSEQSVLGFLESPEDFIIGKVRGIEKFILKWIRVSEKTVFLNTLLNIMPIAVIFLMTFLLLKVIFIGG